MREIKVIEELSKIEKIFKRWKTNINKAKIVYS